jgi:hypothetical protein
MDSRAVAKDALGAGMVARNALTECLQAPKFTYAFSCIGADGEVKWEETISNLVTTQGGNDILDKYFNGSSYSAAWYLGLAGTGTKAAADTASSHAWTEVTPYSGNRPTLILTTAAAAKSKTANQVSFAITGSATVAGAFVQSANTGTSGILYSVSDFAQQRSVVNGDTLNVTLTLSV